MQQDNRKPTADSLPADAAQGEFAFQALGSRQVVASFDGGRLSSDAGVLLLRDLDRSLGLTRKLAACFVDRRDPDLITHSVRTLLAQRVLGLALGYEDLNDHATLRHDPLLSASADKLDGAPLASAPTLNRLELSSHRQGRYHKVHLDAARAGSLLLRFGVQSLRRDRREVVLDLDATDDPLHGKQEGRFFHGYYDAYCYLPLYAFIGDVVVWAQLRTANRDASDGTVHALEKIVAEVRRRRPRARIVIRADSGVCREAILAWCETNRVDYVVGLARNARLQAELEPALALAREKACLCGGAARVYHVFNYKTQNSWSRSRRVAAKAERLGDKACPPLAGQPALHRDQPRGRGGGTLREGVLRARGDGKPHQGAATGSFWRPALLGRLQGQPAAAVAVGLRLRPGRAPASLRPERHGAGAGERGHDPAQALQAGGAGGNEHPSGAGAPERGLPRPGPLRARLGAITIVARLTQPARSGQKDPQASAPGRSHARARCGRNATRMKAPPPGEKPPHRPRICSNPTRRPSGTRRICSTPPAPFPVVKHAG